MTDQSYYHEFFKTQTQTLYTVVFIIWDRYSKTQQRNRCMIITGCSLVMDCELSTLSLLSYNSWQKLTSYLCCIVTQLHSQLASQLQLRTLLVSCSYVHCQLTIATYIASQLQLHKLLVSCSYVHCQLTVATYIAS